MLKLTALHFHLTINTSRVNLPILGIDLLAVVTVDPEGFEPTTN